MQFVALAEQVAHEGEHTNTVRAHVQLLMVSIPEQVLPDEAYLPVGQTERQLLLER